MQNFPHQKIAPPKGCMIGALLSYVTDGTLGKYSPMNVTILPGMKREKNVKADKKAAQVKLANTVFTGF